jgi:hypothetical protein
MELYVTSVTSDVYHYSWKVLVEDRGVAYHKILVGGEYGSRGQGVKHKIPLGVFTLRGNNPVGRTHAKLAGKVW